MKKSTPSLLQTFLLFHIDSRDAIIFWALHGYLVPTGKLIQKTNDGRSTTTRFTIKDSQDAFMYIGDNLESIENYWKQQKEKQKHGQPLILCTGSDIQNIKEIYVYFDNVKYYFNNFLKAVDICVKICFVFNIKFPFEAEMFWSFVNIHFFKMKAERNGPKVHILSELLKK